MEEPPFVDEHRTHVDAPPDRTWASLRAYVDRLLRSTERNPVTLVLGTRPRSGFEQRETVAGERLEMPGRHRFSRYRLVFEVRPEGDGSSVTASTYAAFPGPHGALYRAAVIRSGLHVLATRRMLRAIARAAEAAPR